MTKLFWSKGIAASLILSSAVAWAGAPKPNLWVQVKLDSLGFPGVSTSFLDVGYSMLTVHFLDSSHLLVTYSLRTLVPRIKDDPENHDDRLVAGEVVELPSGKVLARTEWHMHDHARYLWSLGGGRFLMRIGDRMYTMAPLAGLAEGNAFGRTVFPGRRGYPALVDVSPDGGLVMVETVVVDNNPNGPKTILLGDAGGTGEPSKTKAAIDFYRVAGEGGKDAPIEVTRAGLVVAPVPMLLPVDADGLLWASQSGNNKWSVTFDAFGGKTVQLGELASSCQPRLQMLGASEYLAMTCQGADDRIKMMSFGLDGKETWEENEGDLGRPMFAYAPAAARFAMSHTIEAPTEPSTAPVNQTPVGPRQEVRVYQNASGDLLLHVDCNPVFKVAENFDLSADGLLAAVVRNGAIAIYKLPPLSKRDQEDMAEVARFAPPVVRSGAVVMPRLTTPAGGQVGPKTVAVLPAAESVEEPASQALTSVAPEPAAPRPPPTLLKPGEKPEFGTANEQVKPN